MTSFNDYIAVSNNSINENKFNLKKSKSTTSYQLKKLLKPILAKLKRSNNNSKTYKKSPEPQYFVDEYATSDSEIDDNIANELLENEIFEEIDCCEEYAGVATYHQERANVVPIVRGQRYIPVHFARTDAGTFFWTSIVNGADSDINCHGDTNPITNYQTPQLQVASERWAQA